MFCFWGFLSSSSKLFVRSFVRALVRSDSRLDLHESWPNHISKTAASLCKAVMQRTKPNCISHILDSKSIYNCQLKRTPVLLFSKTVWMHFLQKQKVYSKRFWMLTNVDMVLLVPIALSSCRNFTNQVVCSFGCFCCCCCFSFHINAFDYLFIHADTSLIKKIHSYSFMYIYPFILLSNFSFSHSTNHYSNHLFCHFIHS